MRWVGRAVALIGLSFVPIGGKAQPFAPEATTIIAPLAGRLSTPAEGQWTARRFAPDLGLIDVHEGELRIMFGDAIRLRDGDPISLIRDDVQGTISFEDFPNGDMVEAYVTAHPAPAGEPSWRRQGPPIHYHLTALGRASPIVLHDGGASGRTLNTGLFKAPLAAFSNARGGDASGFFTIYARSVPLECSGGESPSCGEGFECDPRLGKIGGNTLEDGAVCVLGQRYCRTVPGGGLCVDPTSSVYDRDLPAALRSAVAWTHSVGNADPQVPQRYFTRAWSTNKFGNLCARTVNDFDPERPHGEGNDYRPTDGADPNASKVFLWGRASYIGTKADGRDLHLYFAVVDVPIYSATGELEWSPRYFTGLSEDGAPQFSPLQTDAVALDLGGSPRPESEAVDIVNQMSISWVEALGAWVMLYGGGANPALAELFTSELGEIVEHDPHGAIQVRFARQPWGPWTAPRALFAGGDPNAPEGSESEGSQYVPGGILRHPRCTSELCAPREPTVDPDDYGFLYAANIVDPWTVRQPWGASVYWNVSTWHPYQVVLMRSDIRRDQLNLPDAPPADPSAGPGGSGETDDDQGAAGSGARDDPSRETQTAVPADRQAPQADRKLPPHKDRGPAADEREAISPSGAATCAAPRALRQLRPGGAAAAVVLGIMWLGMIRKLPSGQYRLYSRKKDPRTGRRRNLGTFPTRAAAEKHERAVQYFKRR